MFKALKKLIIQKSGETHPHALLSLSGVLAAGAWGYKTGTVIRNRLYRSGWIARKQLPCRVISVGNIIAGGTGKTPVTIYLADLLTRMGKKTVVISRGYKGLSDKSAAVVGNGSQVFLDAHLAGDEPHMMARLKRFPVVVGKNRYQAGCLAVEKFTPDVLVLDDGFQHLQLKRDLDLVLMDHDFPLGNGRLLPAGRLREPPGPALARAHAVILTRCPENRPEKSHPVSCLAPGLPLFYTRHQPFLSGFFPAGPPKKNRGSGLRENQVSQTDLTVFQGVSVVLFSGIAHNRAFYRTLRSLGANILDHLEFDDHYRYKRADIRQIQDRAAAVKAQMLVTTEKDWVKLEGWTTWTMDLAVAGIRVVFDDDIGFHRFITRRLQP